MMNKSQIDNVLPEQKQDSKQMIVQPGQAPILQKGCCVQPLRVLNLYAGLGGNRKHWQNVQVTAVEMEPDIAKVYQDLYPNDEVIIGDAAQYLLDHSDNFDFVWTSPPCQTHSRMMKATRHKRKRYSDMSLYQQIIFLEHFFKGRYIVENVKPFYEPLLKPSAILGRHYFWSNFNITQFDAPAFKGFITKDTVAETEELKKWLGISYTGNIYYKGNHSPGQVLRNCVHPDLGLHIFNCAMNKAKQPKYETLSLFERNV